jgi:hypothetical protein
MREQQLYKVSVETPERRTPFGRPSYRWENIKMDAK